jgi:exodeoxyribonuclease VII small subunit
VAGKKESNEPIEFELALVELEAIVRRLEQGGGPLEQALGDYATAIELLKSCHGRLEEAERKIEILSGIDAQGNPITREIDDAALSLEDKHENRGDRRSTPKNQRTAEGRKQSKVIDDGSSLF